MAKVLITCTGLFSNLFSSIALAHELRDDGFDVVFAAPAQCLGDIAASGFEAAEITTPKLGVSARYLPKPGMLGRFGSPAKRADRAAREIRKDGFEQVLAAVRPDVVLPDCEHHSAIIQSAAAGYPVLLLCFMYFVPPDDTVPPVTSAIVPGQGADSDPANIARAWAKVQAKKQRKLRVSAFKGWGADLPSAHRALARTLGLDLAKHTTTQAFQAPWSYLYPTVFLVPKELDFTGKLPAQQHFIGPKVLGLRRDETPDPTMARYFEAPADTKRIYISFGSIETPSMAFVTKLMAVARANQSWEFLFASKAAELLGTMDVPANITFVSWAPQYAALKVADCAIFHGGAGTFNDCIVTATPMLIYPDILDRKGNGARAVFHNVGIVGSDTDTAQTLGRHIETLVCDPAIKDQLQKMQAASLNAQRSKTAKDIITALIG